MGACGTAVRRYKQLEGDGDEDDTDLVDKVRCIDVYISCTGRGMWGG